MTRKNIARDGAAKTPTPIKAHDGMRFVTALPDGRKAAAHGFTKTSFANPLDDSKLITAPTREKNPAPVAVSPGQRSRTAPGGVDKSARLPGKV